MSDVLPTLLGLVPFPSGERFLKQVSGVDAMSAPERMLYHHSSARQLEFGRVQDALSVGAWRYVRAETGFDHLFHRPTDPHELEDVAAVLPVHAALLHLWLMEERVRLEARGAELGHGTPVEMDPDQIEQLKLLGYVDDAPEGPLDDEVDEEPEEEP